MERMRTRGAGRDQTMPKPLDPVDAIRSAIMTAAIIFDRPAQGEKLINELRSLGWF